VGGIISGFTPIVKLPDLIEQKIQDIYKELISEMMTINIEIFVAL
jgi:hypothetical protein